MKLNRDISFRGLDLHVEFKYEESTPPTNDLPGSREEITICKVMKDVTKLFQPYEDLYAELERDLFKLIDDERNEFYD